MNSLVPLCFVVVVVNLLFFTSVAFAAVSIEPLCDDKSLCTVKYKIKESLKLTCNVTSDYNVEVVWEKDGVPVTDIKEMSKRIKSTKESGLYTLHVSGATPQDGGNYSCVAKDTDGGEKRASLVVASKLYISTPDNINVVEGEKLRITCMVIGSPLPDISWIVHDQLYESSKNRVKIMDDNEKKLHNAVLEIEQVDLNDRGEYTCKAYVAATNQTELDTTMVRIKDKYAALWPFLGICGEVFILCAIILVYEKKRNKTELEESDTDQSPEQKNTPDHGGKETNLRHRQ